MKITKILALILAALMLSVCFIACDSEESKETTAETGSGVETVSEMTIKLVVRADGEEKFKGEVKFTGLLGDAIEMFTLSESDYEGDCFDENDILKNVCGIAAGEGQSWTAYYEDLGKDKGVIPSIKTQGPKTDKADGLTEGRTIVLLLA